MNVILFGSSGRIGQRLAAELLERGHSVTGVTRSDDGPISHERFTPTRGDAGDAGRVAELAAGHDVAVSTIGPPPDDPFAFDRTVEGLVDGLVGAGVTRLLMVGSAGTLTVEPGTDLIDSGRIPDDWVDLPKAHRQALQRLRTLDDLDWTYVAPPRTIEPGERTGNYRVLEGQLVGDPDGESRISMEDFAVALADETEAAEWPRAHLGVGY